MSDAQAQIFAAARRDRKIAGHLARDMLKHATTAPHFKPGLLAALRKAGTPTETAESLADAYAKHGVASDATALRDLAAVCRQWGLTWAEIDGN